MPSYSEEFLILALIKSNKDMQSVMNKFFDDGNFATNIEEELANRKEAETRNNLAQLKA
jgi:hypothetical protein